MTDQLALEDLIFLAKTFAACQHMGALSVVECQAPGYPVQTWPYAGGQ